MAKMPNTIRVKFKKDDLDFMRRLYEQEEKKEVQNLRLALERSLRAEREMRENLDAVQLRCTALLEENRALKAKCLGCGQPLCDTWGGDKRRGVGYWHLACLVNPIHSEKRKDARRHVR